MIRKLLGAAAVAALLCVPAAYAADMPAKAKAKVAAPACTSTYCVGFYLGAGIAESGGQFNVISTGLNGIASNNLNMFGEGGYDYWNGTIYAGLNVMGTYGLSANGTLPGGGNSALWGTGAYAKLGYNVAAAFFNVTPTSAGPSIANLAAASTPYVNLGMWCRAWGCGFLSGVGVQGWIASNWTVHVDWNHVNYNNASVNPIATQQTEDMVLGGFDYHAPPGSSPLAFLLP